MRVSVLFPILALAVLAGCGSAKNETVDKNKLDDAQAKSALILDGREIVENNCAGCHGIGASDDSPRTDAPVLRKVLAERDIEALRSDFQEGIHVGANDMPDFDFGTLGTDAVIAYIDSIQIDVPVRTDGKSE